MLKFIPFIPKLYGVYLRHFYNAVENIKDDTPIHEIEKIIKNEVLWIEEYYQGDIEERKKYRALFLFLRDLIRAAWKANFHNNVLELSLPNLDKSKKNFNGAAQKKEELRSWMSESRIERLYIVKDFIHKMESPNKKGNTIRDLIADGNELYSRLKFQGINGIQPYIQLVSDEIDDTGFRLNDIWRYFRLTWSTPSETTPGRTMQYLIRDNSHPKKAIIGIASIENSAVQISDRDEFLCWTPNVVINRIEGAIDKKKQIVDELDVLLTYLEEGIKSIDYHDLNISLEDIMKPNEKTIKKLQLLAEDSESARQESLSLREIDNNKKSGLGSISVETEANLYKRKRSEQLSKYLQSKKILIHILSDNDIEARWEQYSKTDLLYSAIRTALLARKMQHIGSSIMELNVCGAIQPYNEILGGKLVAMLALSPRIISDYEYKYGDRKSEIASRLKNEDVIRPAKLVYLGTTSLYYVGSSQYNRIKIDKEFLVDGSFDIAWKEIGMTMGYGTMHISRVTSQAFQEILSFDVKKINHVFGEGSSPKMRIMTGAIRELLHLTPEETKELSKHAMARVIYGAPLISNLNEYLLGNNNVKPEYYCAIDKVEENTYRIIDFWKSRWLSNRIKNEIVMNKINNFNKDNYLVSTSIDANSRWQFKELKEVSNVKTDFENDNLDFLRGFYKGSSAYSDYIEKEKLKKIHVSTNLDKAIIAELIKGNDVVLTGNPGDGKTHIVRVLEDEFQKVGLSIEIETDASTKTSQEIYDKWQMARKEGKQFVLAINAAVLFSLKRDYPDFKPIISSFNQMIFALDGKDFTEEDLNNVVVFDLSRRNILHKEIVREVIKKFVRKDNFIQYKKIDTNFDESDINRNIKILSSDVFLDRIVEVFNRMYLMGYHATLRELQSFFSYLLIGNRDINKLITKKSSDQFKISELIYSGVGQFFDQIKQTFDPINVSHPQIDEMLISNSIKVDTWIIDEVIPKGNIIPEKVEKFNILKREFYYFNTLGDSLIEISDDYVSKFNRFLNGNSKENRPIEQKNKEQKEQLIVLINAFFGSEKDTKSFDVWQGFRYDFSQRKVLFSTQKIKHSDLSIEIPRLNNIMSKGIDYSPNFLYLVKKNTNVKLKVDFEFYSMLLNVERGIPMLYMDNDMVKRMWAFIEQLNDKTVIKDEEEVTISLFNVQNKKRLKVEIEKDEDEYRYTKIV